MKKNFILLSVFAVSIMNLLHADSNPAMSRVYGDQFTPEVAQTQSAGAIGALDGTFGTSGIFSVNGALSGGQGLAIQTLPNGNFLTVLGLSGSASVVAEYNAQGVLQTYGSAGIATLGSSSTSVSPLCSMLDTQGRLLVGGGANSGSAGWIYRVSTYGTTVSTFTTGAVWQNIGGLAQQSTGAIIAVGFDGTNGRIARYTLAGVIDTTFAATGYRILNGTNSTPTATSGLYSVIVDSDDNIYVLVIDSTNNAQLLKLSSSGSVTASYSVTTLNSATPAQCRLAFNYDGNIILAGQVSGVIKVTALTTTGGSVGGFTNFLTSSISGHTTDTFTLQSLLTTSDDSIYLVGSDSTLKDMAVIRLVGATGALDTEFNTTGYNFFDYATPTVSAQLQAASIAQDGQIYGAGYQSTGGGLTVTPYVVRLYNTQYVSSVSQYPLAQEQGILDTTFGSTGSETYAGITTPFNGSYGSLLKQRAAASIEITAGDVTAGDILVGMNGSINSSANSNMMLTWLTQEGAVDTAVGNSGYLSLTNASSSNEFITSMLQDSSGNIYVAGYTASTSTPVAPGSTSTAAILRAYSSSSTSAWTVGTPSWSITPQTTAGYEAVGVSIQDTRLILCVAESASVGHITSYIAGTLDTTFGASSSGTIAATSYGLNMGPCYGIAINSEDFIFAAYVDSSTTNVNLVSFEPNGSALNTIFNDGVAVMNIFSGYTVAANNVRVGFTSAGNVIVAATTTTNLLVAYFNPITGDQVGSNIVTAITGATSLQLTKVTGVSDGTALCTFWDNAADDTMYVARVTSTALDTTFDSQGSQPGVLSIKVGDKVADYTARTTTSAIVQSTEGVNQGNIVLVGYESVTSSDATPMIMRVYGDPDTTEVLNYTMSVTSPGELETAYNLSSISTGAGNVVFSYPSTNVNNGMLLVGIDTGTNTIITRVNQSDLSVDSTFGSSTGKYQISSLTGVSHISIDASNNILVGGTSGGYGWAQIINNAGTSTTLFDMGSGAATATNIAAVNNIYQQQSGRYIIAGTERTSGKGVLVAFQDKLVSPATKFALDTTFNPLSFGSVVYAGCYYVGTTGLYAMAINSNDTIVAAYSVDGTVTIVEITADGNGVVFGPTSTGVTADSSAVIQLNIDGSGNIVVAGSIAASDQIKAQRFDSAGGTTTPFTGTGVVSGVQTITNVGTDGVKLTSLLATTTQQTVMVGYNSAGGNGRLFAVRLDSTGALDATWNPTPTSPDTAGVLTYATNSAVAMNGAAIAVSGTIISIGSTALNTSGNPIVTKVYGDPLVTQVTQNPLQSAVGTVDTTLPGSSSGALALAGTITGIPAKTFIYTSTINSSPYGAMLVASVATPAGVPTVYISQLNADLTLNTNFGAANGVRSFTPNSGLSPSAVVVTDMYVANGINDATQPIYVTGYTTTTGVNTMFAALITSNGASATLLTSVTGISGATAVTGCIRQSSNSRVLISGYNGSSGVIVAYNSDMTAIDTSFGNNSGTGLYTTGVATSILAMATDNSDRIYIAYKSGSAIAVQRLLENGTAVDSTFSATFITTVNGYSATQIKMAIDLTNSQVVVAAQDGTSAGNILQVARFSFSGGTVAAGAISTITMTGKILSLSDLFIDSVQNIYVIGNNTTNNYAVVARVVSQSLSTIALDSTYAAAVSPAPTGVANVSFGSMTAVNAGLLNPDGRVYLFGSGSGNGYLGRLFGNQYNTQISPANLQGLVGAIDLTLFPNYTGGIDLSAQSGWSGLAGYTAYANIENPNGDGTSFIAFGNGTNLIVGKVNADMVPVTYGTSGLTTALAMATVNSMTIDSLGYIIVSGTTVGNLQKVVSFNTSGVLQATFNAPTLASTVGTTVVQQKSGRYLLGGYDGSANGIVSAYKNASAISSVTLAVDTTFGPSANSGYFPTGINGQIDDICIDSNDYIYIVYRNSSVVNVAKLTPEGCRSTSDNTPSGQVWSTNPITATGITATQAARIAINNENYILIGATTASDVSTKLYNGSTGAAIGSLVSVTTAAGRSLTKLVGSGTKFYGAVYTSTPSALAFSINDAGALDSGFGTSGLMTATAVQSVTSVRGISVQADGKVVMVGGNASPAPVLIRAYGYPYVAQYAQAPNQAAAGILDTTLWPTTGALELDTYAAIGTVIGTLSGSSVSRIYEYSNGKALLLFSGTNSGADTVLARVNKDLTLDSSFNSVGYVTISTKINATSLFVNSAEEIFVAGGSTTSWTRAYNADGTTLTGWATPTSNLSAGAFEIGQQSFGRVILAGKNTNGTLYGYNTAGVLDVTFNETGSVGMGSTDAITDFALDAYSNIITIKTTAGSTVLQKVSPSGLTVTTLSGGTAIANATGNAKVVLDTAGKIVVATATTTGFTIARYNNDATGTNSGASQVTITIGGSSTSHLGNMYATSDGNIVVVGYETTANKVVVARLISSPSASANANIILDTANFNVTGSGIPGVMETVINSAAFIANDGFICADDRIMIAGTQALDPYLARVFGDTYVTYTSQAPIGVPGTLDVSFGSTTPPTGQYNISTLSGITAGSIGQAILATTNGGYYMGLTNASNSQLIRTVANGTLDTSYNGSGIAAATAPLGLSSMMMDGLGKMVLVGTTGGAGWVQRYTTAGGLDTTTFGASTGKIAAGTIANVAIEQTPARLIVAGANGSGGALFAFTSINPNASYAGTVDTTFNSIGAGATTGGTTPGIFLTNTTNGVYTVIADQYDRLIYAVLNNTGTAIDLYRLTPSGEYDWTFGSTGKVANALTTNTGGLSGNIASNIRVALDSNGNIVLAAYTYSTGTLTDSIKVVAYDNGIATGSGSNGSLYTNPYSIINLAGTANTGISLTSIVTTSDGYVLVQGNELVAATPGSSPTWVARFANTTYGGTYVLDTNFNPSAVGGTAGIFKYSAGGGTTSPYHVYNTMAVNATGVVGVLGYEDIAGTDTPSLIQINNDPYATEESQSPDSKAIGSNDITLGVSPTSSGNLGIIFYGTSSQSSSYGQVARAVALQDDNNILVAMDGDSQYSDSDLGSQIYLSLFNNDGILNPTFGQQRILSYYYDQYVSDMITFTSGGVNKAIIAGYASDSTLGVTGSLVAQYNLTSPGLDSSFGAFDGNPNGVAFGDAKQAFVVGQQSTGRIIVGGLTQGNTGVLLGYTSAGKLDPSFGNDGYQSTNTGSTGIYTHAIDSQNRVVIAYNNAGTLAVARFLADGSALDGSFGTAGLVTTNITGLQTGVNNNFKVAIDGSENIIVAAVTGNGTTSKTITVYSYVPAGTSTNATASFTGGTSFAGTSSSTFTIGRLLVDALGNVIIVASDSNPTPDQIVVTRITSALALDTTFNTNGWLSYDIAAGNSQQVTDALIHPDGRIIVVGSEN